MDISFIIVNYKSEDLLLRCIASISENMPTLDYEILVINNDETPLNIALEKIPLRIINNGENRGFAKACNIGAQAASGEILFFLNPDTEIKTPNISNLAEQLADPSIGIAAPRLIDFAGSIQPWSAGCAIDVLDILRNNLGYIKSKQLWLRDTPGEVDWVSGAALAISKKTFSDCSGFDGNFFMYFEDIDLCKRVKLLNKKIILLPQVVVSHLGGQCHENKQKQKKNYYPSQDYYLQKHFGKTAAFFVKYLRKIVLFFTKN